MHVNETQKENVDKKTHTHSGVARSFPRGRDFQK